MIYPAEYEVKVWNSDEEKIETVHGVTFGVSFTEAMESIEDYYGEDLCSVTIILLEESEVYEFEDTQSQYRHGLYKINDFSKWEE